MRRTVLFILLCLAVAAPLPPAVCSAAAADPEERGIAKAPPLELRRALDLAESYIAANRVDLTRQHLRSARLLYDEGKRRRGLYWHFQWAWTSPAIGGEYGLRVYMDGTILPERLGP
jgi:hypothetical protein